MQVTTGDRVGRLIVGQPTRKTRKNGTIKAFECQCDCGSNVVVDAYNLANRHTQSCGCLQRERTSGAKRLHGASHTKPYLAWQGMLDRCYNPKNKSYPLYGGRGVSVYLPWVESYTRFIEDVGYKTDPRLSLDRIDVNGNYEPGNVRWATATEQARNRRARHDNNTGVNGVVRNKCGSFDVSIRVDGKQKTRRVRDFLDAVALRYRLEREHWGSNNP